VYFVASTIAGNESSLLRTYCLIPGGIRHSAHLMKTWVGPGPGLGDT